MTTPLNPFSSEMIQEPLDSHWAAKRCVTKELHRLVENFVTCTTSAEELNELANVIKQQADILEQDEQLFGRHSFDSAKNSRFGHFMDVGYELNPLIGHSNPIAPPLHVWTTKDTAHGSATLGWQYEGPPGAVHGGFVAALFDQFLGVAQKLTDQPGVTGTLTTKFLKPTPVATELQLIGRVERIDGRKNIISGEMWAEDQMTASCEGIFIHISKEQFDSLIERNRPT